MQHSNVTAMPARERAKGAPAMPPAMILCGGQGTRLRDVSEALPKPMVAIGRHPILWHIMKTYSAAGTRRFILCLGYKREVIIDYFLNYAARSTDVTVHLGERRHVTFHQHVAEDWEVTLVDTGDRTGTGGRVARAARYLRPTDRDFFLTYGDGVADIDVRELLAAHKREGRAVTMTAVRPSSRFGEMKTRRGRVVGFHEKPQTDRGLINGGFMVMKRSFVSDYLTTDEGLALEEAPLRSAVANGQVSAFVHEGFWQCMDTPREHALLSQLWDSGKAPWSRP